MFPGTALGVLVGNLMYTRMAITLARREGRTDVTAMPLGLDAPTSIGMALLVLGPAFAGFSAQGLEPEAAGIRTWQLGMAALVIMGALKFVLAFFGDAVRRAVPRAGLLGSIAGIALELMGFLPLVEILRVPIVGFVGLGLVLALLLGTPRFAKLPSVPFAVLIGTALYHALGSSGLIGDAFHAPPAPQWRLALPWPNLGFVPGLADAMPYLPLLLPFGLLMVIGGINVTESAHAAGDRFRTRDILLVEAFSTLVAGVCGGVAQTTPYIGQPSYKAMGAGHRYTLATGLFVGLGGMLGVLAALVEFLPPAVLAPILVFVAIGICVQAFEATPRKYWAAVVIAFFPAVARMVAIKLGDPSYVPFERFAELYAPGAHGPSELFTIVVLGNGFILTSMVWAACFVAIIDGRSARAAFALLVGALLTAFGLIHSIRPDAALYLPWQLVPADQAIVAQWALGYVVLAVLLPMLIRADSARRS
jgi:AGZA family xanthine/uracil permease-like MFS transporter